MCRSHLQAAADAFAGAILRLILITNASIRSSDFQESTVANASFGWRGWLLVLSISAALCCFELGSARALTDHEVLVAGGAKQMLLDHDWAFPKIGDHLWLEKPPLLHWIVIGSAKLFGGFSEASARLPSVIAGLGVVVIISLLAIRWFGERVAIFTALVQTTTVYFITYARLVEAEMLLAFLVVLALYVFVRLHSIGARWPQPRPYLAFLFWGLIGLSNMAKGLGFGPVLILAPCVAFLILKRDRVAWKRMISWSGWAVGFAIALAWPIIIARQVPEAGELWRAEIARRALGWSGYHQPAWYYLMTAPWQLLPWTPALLLIVAPSLARAWRQPDSPDRFIWCWALVPIVLLSLFQGKHHHYIISCLCALSPLCALGLLRGGTRLAIACVALASAGILFVHAYILPRSDPSKDDRDFLVAVRGALSSDLPLVATGYQELARYIFYIDPPPQGIWDVSNLERRAPQTSFYLVARLGDQARLAGLGKIEVMLQSRHTRKEQGPADRFTLFRIDRSVASSSANSSCAQ